MVNNYDRVAAVYDRLSRLIFGNAIVSAQRALLPCIEPSARVLIVGGGTGWILEEMAKLHPTGLTIDYVEISSNMLDLAKKRDWKGNQVTFVHAAIENYDAPARYDVVMTPFLFDNFSRERAGEVFQKLDSYLRNGALWLFNDFHIDQNLNRLWQKALLRSMYIFFRNISNIEARQLPDMQTLFNAHSYEKGNESFHFGRFIRSAAYRKSGNSGAVTPENVPFVKNHNG